LHFGRSWRRGTCRQEGCHLSKDLADKVIGLIRDSEQSAPSGRAGLVDRAAHLRGAQTAN
jgi:hypothetical protein